MGDIWVFSQSLFNPVNVKAGEANKGGQPNIVALRKLLRAILSHQIDSYYLLIVKMVVGESVGLNNVYFTNILDHLGYVTFDSGPGQMMLKEKLFYAMLDRKAVAIEQTLDQKIQTLFQLLDDADRRLMQNRLRIRATINEMHRTYEANKGRPLDQSRLNLQ